MIDHTTTRFEDAVQPVDLVFDTAGGDRLVRSPAVLRDGGRLVSIAEESPGADFFIVVPDRDQLIAIGERVDAGTLQPAIDSVYALADARAAFARSMQRDTRGKVVLSVAAEVPSPYAGTTEA